MTIQDWQRLVLKGIAFRRDEDGCQPQRIQRSNCWSWSNSMQSSQLWKQLLDKVMQKRKFVSGDLQCKCHFHIKIKASKFYVDAKKKHRPDWNNPDCSVTIVDGILSHSGDCKPSTQQHIFTKSRSDKYVEDISNMALYTLCNSASKNGRAVNSIVSSLLDFGSSQFAFTMIKVNAITFDPIKVT